MASTMDADVIIVGAGFAGLSAADTLTAHRRSVIVLEARSRVGDARAPSITQTEYGLTLGDSGLAPDKSGCTR